MADRADDALAVDDGDPPQVALAVVTSGFRVLLVARRDQRPPVAFPGGKRRAGETSAAAAARETLEETGVEVEMTTELGRRRHPVTRSELTYCAARPTGLAAPLPRVAPDEVTAAWWAPLDEALTLLENLYEPVRDHLVTVLSGVPET